jgi:hypothetical protein
LQSAKTIGRAFVQLREMLASNKELDRRFAHLECQSASLSASPPTANIDQKL